MGDSDAFEEFTRAGSHANLLKGSKQLNPDPNDEDYLK